MLNKKRKKWAVCPWCRKSKCSHCRCSGFAGCTHARGVPCERVRYGRRLVCNPCEKHKLIHSKKVIAASSPEEIAALSCPYVPAPMNPPKTSKRGKAKKKKKKRKATKEKVSRKNSPGLEQHLFPPGTKIYYDDGREYNPADLYGSNIDYPTTATPPTPMPTTATPLPPMPHVTDTLPLPNVAPRTSSRGIGAAKSSPQCESCDPGDAFSVCIKIRYKDELKRFQLPLPLTFAKLRDALSGEYGIPHDCFGLTYCSSSTFNRCIEISSDADMRKAAKLDLQSNIDRKCFRLTLFDKRSGQELSSPSPLPLFSEEEVGAGDGGSVDGAPTRKRRRVDGDNEITLPGGGKSFSMPPLTPMTDFVSFDANAEHFLLPPAVDFSTPSSTTSAPASAAGANAGLSGDDGARAPSRGRSVVASAKPVINYARLKSLDVGTLHNVDLKFWDDCMKGNAVLLHLIRRYGCGICRDTCREIGLLKPALDMMGVRLIGVGNGEVGLEPFLEGGFWKGDLVIDKDGEIFKALGCGHHGSVWGLLHPQVLQAIMSATHAGDPTTAGGDRFIMAGTFVFSEQGEAVLEARQSNFADSTSLYELIEACRLVGGGTTKSKAKGKKGSPGKKSSRKGVVEGSRRNSFDIRVNNVLPTNAIKKPPADVLNCGHCGTAFGYTKWKYHCMRCGELNCNDCSKHSLIIPGRGDKPVRCCNSCMNEMNAGPPRSLPSQRGIGAAQSPSPPPPPQQPTRHAVMDEDPLLFKFPMPGSPLIPATFAGLSDNDSIVGEWGGGEWGLAAGGGGGSITGDCNSLGDCFSPLASGLEEEGEAANDAEQGWLPQKWSDLLWAL